MKPFKLTADFDKRKTLLLGNISAVGELSPIKPLDDIKQAFTGPLVDQNGNFVYYEILMDPNEVRYICENKLYSIDGQIDFSKTHKTLDLPSGVDTQDASGAFELKLAWKILEAGDDPARYLTMPAVVATAVNGQQVDKNVRVGLVGMHIAHKSKSSPQWIWSTFEQVDNLDVDPVAHSKLKPSFFDPGCPTCVPNQEPSKKNGNWIPSPKTQAVRAIPIPNDKRDLNVEAELALAKIGSPLQYYQLIDTQWPTDPAAAPTPWTAGLPGAITNKPGGNPTLSSIRPTSPWRPTSRRVFSRPASKRKCRTTLHVRRTPRTRLRPARRLPTAHPSLARRAAWAAIPRPVSTSRKPPQKHPAN